MEEILHHARLSTAIRSFSATMAAELDPLLYSNNVPADGDDTVVLAHVIFISNNRLNGLMNSLAWHERRSAPRLRVQAFVAELQRLQQQAQESSNERLLYDFLLQKLGSGTTPGDWTIRLFQDLRLSEAQRNQWHDRVRFMLAQTALQIIQTLLRGTRLRQDIEHTFGGALRWR